MKTKQNSWCIISQRNTNFLQDFPANGKTTTINTVKEFKPLGTILTNDLKWNKNTKHLGKRAYARMELWCKMSEFTKDKLNIYKTYIRSVLEKSSVVWNSNITKQNERKLERVKKVSINLILGKYESYIQALKSLNIETIKERRQLLSNRFTKKMQKIKEQETCKKKTIIKNHNMKLGHFETLKVINAKTVRMEKYAIPTMIKHLNEMHKENQRII